MNGPRDCSGRRSRRQVIGGLEGAVLANRAGAESPAYVGTGPANAAGRRSAWPSRPAGRGAVASRGGVPAPARAPAQRRGFVREPLMKCPGLLDTTRLQHGAAPMFEEGGSATGVFITDLCHGPCGDKEAYAAARGESVSFGTLGRVRARVALRCLRLLSDLLMLSASRAQGFMFELEQLRWMDLRQRFRHRTFSGTK